MANPLKKKSNYLKSLYKLRDQGYHVSELIALIRQNSVKEQDVDKRFVPTNKFQGLL